MKFTLSRRGDYVVRAALCLARAYRTGASCKVREVAAEAAVPRSYAPQILQALAQAGLATARAGKDGGFRLARPPEEVTLLEVVTAADGPFATVRCPLGGRDCRSEEPCPLHEALAGTVTAAEAVLSRQNLAGILAEELAGEEGRSGHWWAEVSARWALVDDTVEVALPAALVGALVLQQSGSWLAPLVHAAADEGSRLRMRLGPTGTDHRSLSKSVEVSVGDVVDHDGTLVVALSWRPTGRAGLSSLFPSLDGRLLVASLGDGRSLLRLTGRYQPPLGRTGHLLDEVVMNRVAAATAHSFLRRLAGGLEERSALASGDQLSTSGAAP